MVKAGFIVEGTSDFIIIKSERFHDFLFHRCKVESNEGLIRVAGSKSEIKISFKSLTRSLLDKVDHIFVMVDQDDKEEQKRNRKYKPPDCPKIVIEEIMNYRDNSHYKDEKLIFIVMTREMEAWFLADPNLGFRFDGQPEEVFNPSDVVAAQIGSSSHVIIANKIKNKFSLERAAANAASARRFLDILTEIGQE